MLQSTAEPNVALLAIWADKTIRKSALAFANDWQHF